MGFKDFGSVDVGWINLAQVKNKLRAFVNTVINLRFAENSGKFLIS
jgi:hypothetical protein